MSSSANQIDLNVALPFSQRVSEVELQRLAEELLESLSLSAKVQIIAGNGEQGLEHERRFRLSWWTNGEEPMRASLHRAKLHAAQRTREEHKEASVLEAWKQTERMTSSQRWREHFRALARQASFDERQYLRIYFRIAQLFWNRAARWDTIFSASVPCPFRPFLALLASGILPLGCHEQTLQLFVWDKASHSTMDFGPKPAFRYSMQERHIFFSAPFREAALTERWREAFHAKGWKTVHGSVSEEAPPEFALGQQIAASAAVIGLLNEVDDDFGLPWWMHQELDCACFFKRPTALISPAKILTAELQLLGLHQISDPLMSQNAPHGEHEIWQWLNGLAI